MQRRKGLGGQGGDARVDGDNSSADGGRGGDGVIGDGGRGGDATVKANNSRGVGGRGGRGGIGPGGPGGDVYVARDAAEMEQVLARWEEEDRQAGGGRGGRAYAVGDDVGDVFLAGGDGGEANQPDGRGGRGGRSHMPEEWRIMLGSSDRPHMRPPYFEPYVPPPGSGGFGPDAPQYMARRIILERLKARYLACQNLTVESVWYDREVVPLDWLNRALAADGHRWTVAVVDWEYEFTDGIARS